MLLLCNGLNGDDLVSVIENLKNSSKAVGQHKRRELYWEGYTAMATTCSSADGPTHCLIKYSTFEGDGKAEFIELTKRQKGLVSGGCDIVGCKKHKPDADADKPVSSSGSSSGWVAAWAEEGAKTAYDDLTSAEPCVYLSGDALYVGTRFKRVLCKSYSTTPLKTLKEIEKAVAEAGPQLRSVSWTGNSPPVILPYNVIVCGATATVAATLPDTLGTCANSGSFDVYDAFLARRSDYELGEAGKMLAQMHTDISKGLQPLIYCASMKDAGSARKNALLKKCYVHESKGKFIAACQEDDIDVSVIYGEVDESKDFYKYGGIVFELFYRTDLSVLG